MEKTLGEKMWADTYLKMLDDYKEIKLSKSIQPTKHSPIRKKIRFVEDDLN
jgi:hypothetical protein